MRNTIIDRPDWSDDELAACDFAWRVCDPPTSKCWGDFVLFPDREEASALYVSDSTSSVDHRKTDHELLSSVFGGEDIPPMSLAPQHVSPFFSVPENTGDTCWGVCPALGSSRFDNMLRGAGDRRIIHVQTPRMNTLENSATDDSSLCPGCGVTCVPEHNFCPYCQFELHRLPRKQNSAARPLSAPDSAPGLLRELNKLRYVEACATDVQLALAAVAVTRKWI